MRNAVLMAAAAIAFIGFGSADARAAAEHVPAAAGQTSDSGATSGTAARQEITIEGQRALEKKVSEFVTRLTDFGDVTTGMGRWREPICPLVSGISRQQGDYVLARISEIAQAAGAPLAGKKCRPNLVIIVSGKPKAVLDDLVKRHRTALFADAPLSQIDAWVATPRPVRTWYNTVEKTPEGLPLLRVAMPGNGAQLFDKNGNCCVPVSAPADAASAYKANQWSHASHLTLNGVWTIYRVVEVVDATRLNGASLGQLADYVAMSGLAQLLQGANLGDDPTILTLFDKSPRSASPGLTFWDRTFLKSIYSTEQRSVLQRREIAQQMVRAIAAH